MTDYQPQMAYIAKTDSADGLRQLMANARREGANSVEEAAFRKLIALGIEHPQGSIEHDFWRTVNAFEATLKDERGKTVRLSRTRQKVARAGVVQTLADWALGKPTDGFSMLLERDMPELLGESIVLRHEEQFSPEVVAAARSRLIDAGVDLDRVTKS